MIKKIIIIISILLFSNCESNEMDITILKNKIIQIDLQEKWWGGDLNKDLKMPYKTRYLYTMFGNLKTNYAQRLLLSNQGRVVWSEPPFKFTISDTQIVIKGINKIHVIDRNENFSDALEFVSK